MIEIKYSGGIIEVYSPYNNRLVEIFRGLSNRKWNPEKKCWQVGLTSLEKEFLPAIKKANMLFEFDESFSNFFTSIAKNAKKTKIDFKLKLPLYEFQKEGAKKMVWSPFFALFDDMGVGKTVQTIAAINKLKEKGEAGKVLIICPNSLKKQWHDEIKKFSNMSSLVIEGNKAKRQNLWEKRVRIKIINYELVRFDDYPFYHEWDILVLDEASRIKNSFAKTTRYIKKIRAKRRYVLTGTPIENMITDLYSIFEFLNPTILPSYRGFKEEYLITRLRNFGGLQFEEIVGYKNLDKLKKVIGPYYIRRRKEEVLKELPSLVNEKIWVELNPSERKHYNAIKKIIEEKIDNIKAGDDDSFNSILGEMTLLRVLCNGEICLKWSNPSNTEIQKMQPLMKETSSKNDECMNLIRSIIRQNGDKIIVFSDYVAPLKDLEDRLMKGQIGYSSLYGTIKNREEEIEKFRKNSNIRVLLSQIRTGGYGLNLQEANQVIFLNNPWNPAVKNQALSRTHRNGQKKTVFVYDLIVRDSIEERVLKALENKTALSEKVIAKNIKKYM